MGMRATSTCQLVLEDVQVPRSQVLGAPGDGFKIAMQSLDCGRIGIAAQATIKQIFKKIRIHFLKKVIRNF